MKKLILSVSFILNLVFITGNSSSQWINPVSLTTSEANYTGLTTNSARSIAVSGSDIYVVWHDSRWWTSGDIYFRRSTNGGANWQAETVLTNNQPESINPSIAVYGNTIHVVWEEYRDGNAEIYYKRSTNNGAAWGSDVRLTNNAAFSEFPAITVSANGVHIAWREYRDGNTEVYYKRSTNEGLTWGSDIRLTNNTSSTGYPSIVSNGMGIHIAFPDYRNGNDEIYYKASTDNGTTWGADTRLTNNSASSVEPCITSSGLNLYIAFVDTRTTHRHIYLKKSTNLGGTWSAETQITSQYYDNYAPSITTGNNGNNIHIAYYFNFAGNQYDVFYIGSTNSGSSWNTPVRLNQLPYGTKANIAVSSSTVHIVYRWKTDVQNNMYDIYYIKNPTGNPTGITNTGNKIPLDFSLSQNYPNPFNPVTNINFSIPVKSIVKLTVYDELGKETAVLVNKDLDPGTYKIDFNASNLPSGVYFCKLEAGDFNSVKKMILIK